MPKRLRSSPSSAETLGSLHRIRVPPWARDLARRSSAAAQRAHEAALARARAARRASRRGHVSGPPATHTAMAQPPDGKLLCQRIGCDARYTEDANPEARA
jgi:hypothetical protein